MTLQQENPPNRSKISRRTAIRTASAAAIATLINGLPVYHQELAPIPKRGRENNRIAVILDAIGERDEITGRKLQLESTAGSVWAADYALRSIMPPTPGQPITRGDFMKSIIAAGAATASSGITRLIKAVREDENQSLANLAQDLEQAGYTVHHTTKLPEFMSRLGLITEKRGRNPQTIIIINAHGNEDVIATTKTDYVGYDQLAEALNEIPGHKLLVSQSCQMPITPFTNANHQTRGPISLYLAQPGSKNYYAGLPFFTALRHGLRHPKDVIQGTRQALRELLPHAPMISKLLEKRTGAPTIKSNHPYKP